MTAHHDSIPPPDWVSRGRGGPPLALGRAGALVVLEAAAQASRQQGDHLPPDSGWRASPSWERWVCLFSGTDRCSRKRFAFSAHNAFAKIAIHRIMQYPFHPPIFLVTLLLARETHLAASQLACAIPALSTSSFPCLSTGPGTWASTQG